METIMNVTDLVRDTCKAATRRIQRGDKITITSGGKTLFKVVPVENSESTMTPKRYKAFARDLQKIADLADLDANPIVKMRQERG